MTPYETLLSIEDRLSQDPGETELTQIRDRLQSRGYRKGLLDFFRERNFAPGYDDDLVRIANLADQKRAERSLDASRIATLGLGGGSSLVVGGIFTAITLTGGAAAIALIPIAGGLYMSARSYSAQGQLAREELLLKQITEELRELRRGFSDG